MWIRPFGVEEWMNEHETRARLNVAETCVAHLTVREVLELSDLEGAQEELLSIKLDYGEIPGSLRLRRAIASLYGDVSPEEVLVCHGGIGANFLVLWGLVERGDLVVSVWPTYQQLLSVAEALGAEVRALRLREEDAFLPDLEELSRLCEGRARLICLNNPNNPTGALMDAGLLSEICGIADRMGAYVLCDEVYRGLEHEGEPYSTPSVVDLYERGISTGSVSKVYSASGLRVGWIAARREVLELFLPIRDYTTISCGKVDDLLSSLLLENRDEVLARNLPLVRGNREALLRWVESTPGLSVVPPRAGTTAFVKFFHRVPSRELCLRLLEEEGVLFVPGTAFGPEHEGYLRLGYACRREVLEEALSRTSSFLSRLPL